MMNEDINELIASYDEEKEVLKTCLNECLEDLDYAGAHQFQKSIAIVNQQLLILNTIKDPFYPQQIQLERTIDYYNKSKIISPLISDYIDEQIEKTKIKLDALRNSKAPPFYDGLEFDDALFDLVNGKILSFIFHLKKSSNLYLKFTAKKRKLIISVTPDKQIEGEIHFPESKKRLLRTLGFKRNKTKERFEFKFPLSCYKDSLYLKTIVSRVIYEVFYRNELDTETTLAVQSNY